MSIKAVDHRTNRDGSPHHRVGCVHIEIGAPTRLAKAIAEFGRIDKTLHTLTYIDDEATHRGTLTQLNRGEGRHSVVARAVSSSASAASCARKTSWAHSA